MINPKFSDELAIAYKDQRITHHELKEKALGFAALLDGKNMDKIAIFSENSPEWMMAFYAAWHHNITVVPLDFVASSEDVTYILNDCQAEFVFYSKNTEEILHKALKNTKHTIKSVCLDREEITPIAGEWNQPSELDKTAVIIYTSGTTGSPKGVMLSYTNLFTNVKAVTSDIPIYEYKCRVLLVLPLQHIFPLIGVMLAPLSVGGMVVITPSLQGSDIIDTLQKFKITHIIGVPRFFEMIYKGVINKINASPVSKGLYNMVRGLKSPKLGKMIFKKVHEQFGGELHTLVSGGAALSTEVGGFFDGLGFTILEGYGMTEAAPMISFTHPGDVIIGCAGKTMDCLDVQIRDGEVVAKGESIMKGYYNRPEETAEVIKDGWLLTGDLGYLDGDHLYITGRKKEIIVLSNGKNINPSELEDSMTQKAGDSMIEVGITLHEDVLQAVILPNFKELSNHNITDVQAYFTDFLTNTFNPKVTPYKQVSKFTIVKEVLPRTRLSKLQRFKLAEIIENGQKKTERKPEPTTKEYLSIKQYLEELIGKDVFADNHLVFDLALDSLAKLELIDYIERTFGLLIKEEELLNYNSFGEMVQFIASHKEHFEEIAFDWHEMMTKPLDIKFKKPWWTLAFLNFKSRILLKMSFKIERSGLKSYPDGAGIIAPNHSSFLDVFLVASLLKKKDLKDTFFYGKKAHINSPFRRIMAKHNNVIIMDIEKDLYHSIQQISQVLREGKKLVIFPEGTRSQTGELGAFKSTFAILSKELQVPVYPVAITGAFAAWPRHKKTPITGSAIKVNYLPAILPKGLDEKQISAKVKAAITAAL
ncbi:MAG: AMP-binding protein [Bacteroidales bacterium]|jgi:long-chain acyl-CoA synthetase|nr:AMP-binding protein [Bacteroidales bacterium]